MRPKAGQERLGPLLGCQPRPRKQLRTDRRKECVHELADNLSFLVVQSTEDGFDLDPSWLTKHFTRILLDHDLFPIRLHDVRHTAGSLMIASGSDPKIVQATLGRSDLKLTLGVYVSLYEEVAQTSADAVASFIPRGARSV